MGAPRSVTPRTVALLRALLVVALVAMTLPLFVLLFTWSVSGSWLYPALRPSSTTISAWQDIVNGGALGTAFGTSALLGAATGLFGAALAMPVGCAVAQLSGWRRHLAAGAAFLPVAAPPLALGTGLQVVAISVGVGGSFSGVLLSHLVPAVGYLSLMFLGTFLLYDTRAEEAARTLGATRAQVWWRVTLPILRRPIAEAIAVGFLISWTQVALTLVVGGGAVRTLPLEVYAFIGAGQDRAAAVGALLLIVPAAGALAALRFAMRRTAVAPA
jgi:putative spermidine/putrescine transport system permease protein